MHSIAAPARRGRAPGFRCEPAAARSGVSANLAVLACALFIVLADNLRFWQGLFAALPPAAPASWLLYGVVFVVCVAAYQALLSLAAWPGLLKPVLSLVLAIAAVCAYFMDAFGVVIGDDMLHNLVQTDMREAFELLTPEFFLYVGLLGVLPIGVLWRTPVRYDCLQRELLWRALAILTSLAVGLGVLYADFKNVSIVARQNRELRYRLNPYYPIGSLRHLLPARAGAPQDPRGRRAYQAVAAPGARPKLVVLVVGETARAANFGLDGYERDTTPRMAELAPLNFSRTSSCGTATAVSVPCMFSRLTRSAFGATEVRRNVNLIDVLDTAGVPVHWLDNDSGCKGVCARASYHDLSNAAVPGLCDTDGCYDEVLVRALPPLLDRPQGDTLVVLHFKGSHGPAYYRRYPADARLFTPDCETPSVQECSREQIVNAYDNTIAYTDRLLGEIADALRQRGDRFDTAMIYLSDHGESLGENGFYLHGLPYTLAPREQTQVPFLVWLSPAFARHAELGTGCLRAAAAAPASHDNLFHLVLGLFRVRTDAYVPELDPFAACRTRHLAVKDAS